MAPAAMTSSSVPISVRAILPSPYGWTQLLTVYTGLSSWKPDLRDRRGKPGIGADRVPCAIDVQEHQPGRTLGERLAQIAKSALKVVELRVSAGEVERGRIRGSRALLQRPQFQSAHRDGFYLGIAVRSLRLGEHGIEFVIRVASQRMSTPSGLNCLVEPALRAANFGQRELRRRQVRVHLDHRENQRGSFVRL